jgi:hypothetical protein
LGRFTEKVCNLSGNQAIISALQDDRTKEKIEQNLKLLNEDLNIKRIHRKINDYLKLINKEARTRYYTGMKEEVNYP